MFAPPGKMIGFGQLSIYPFRCQAKCTEHVPGRPCIPANSARYAIKMPPEWRGLPGRGGRPAQDVAEYSSLYFLRFLLLICLTILKQMLVKERSHQL